MWIFIFFGIHVYSVAINGNLIGERIKEYYVSNLEDRLADLP
jgi:hypothetical protein